MLLIYSRLFQRKELCKLQEKLELQKKKLSDTIANRKKFLSSLPSHLKSLKKASLPVQNQLGILHTKKIKQHHLAELLPPPLYVIYSEFLAQKEAFGENIDLEIVGSVKDAQAFARQQANKDTGNWYSFSLCNYLVDSYLMFSDLDRLYYWYIMVRNSFFFFSYKSPYVFVQSYFSVILALIELCILHKLNWSIIK